MTYAYEVRVLQPSEHNPDILKGRVLEIIAASAGEAMHLAQRCYPEAKTITMPTPIGKEGSVRIVESNFFTNQAEADVFMKGE